MVLRKLMVGPSAQEWRNELRSVLHPLLFAALYRGVAGACALLGVAAAPALAVAPRVAMALCTAMGDWATARLAGRLWGSDVGWLALGVSLGSAWTWFAGPRTLANSLEAVITAGALGLWPWTWATGAKGPRTPRGEIRGALALAAVACVLRPTNVLVWLSLGAFALWNTAGRKRVVLIAEAAWIGFAPLARPADAVC